MPKTSTTPKLIGYLLRDIPQDTMDKIRAAAAIHKKPAKIYIRDLFEAHIKELEGKGLTLSAPGLEVKRRKKE